ncbi:MAG: GNAT family N-acetyltransferase [Burkholderiaceae bacterium]
MLNYRMQVLPDFASLSVEQAEAWDRLWALSPEPTPFTHRLFLTALETSGSAVAKTGWQAHPVLLRDQNDKALAATPLYGKSHSYGEYVFDWAWAQAYEQTGRAYFPKWLIASPFSPVPGSRLLGEEPLARQALAQQLTELAQSSGLSSMHCLFGSKVDHQALSESGWLTRQGVQFHWHNRGYNSFEDFCQTLTQPRRKKIRAERRKVEQAGIRTQVLTGLQITEAQWQFFYDCYEATYLAHGNPPYLKPAFFKEVAKTMPWAWVMALGLDPHDQPVGAALLAHQPAKEQLAAALSNQSEWVFKGGALYGRYWGSLRSIDCLHFELAYYTPMAWAIDQGIARFEGGAQGEHKVWRGFEPVTTQSSHWLAEKQFESAVARFLEREKQGLSGYLSELSDRQPYRNQAS